MKTLTFTCAFFILAMIGVYNSFAALVQTPMIQDIDGNGYDIININQINAGTVITTDLISRGPWVNVMAFGAKGDNVTDDTDAIQNAIDTGAAVIFVPAGQYKVSGITLGANQTLHGVGMKSQIKLLAGYPANNILTIGGDNTVIKDLDIYNAFGDNPNPTGRVISIVGYKNCQIINVFATGGTAVFLSNTSGVRMINVHLEQCFEGYGLRLNGEGGSVKNCSFTNMVLYCNLVGMRMSGDVSSISFNNVVSQFNIEHGFWLDDGVQYNQLTGCIAFFNGKYGFYIRHASHNILKDCVARDNSKQEGLEGVYSGFGIVGSGSTNNSIQGCVATDSRGVFSATQRYGIYIEAPASQSIIISNVLSQNKVGGLYEYGITDSYLGHNFTDDVDEKHSGFEATGYISLQTANGNTGSFTLTTNASTSIANTSITNNSKVIFFPANAAAANLVNGSKSPYISTVTSGQGFTISTADGTAANGSELFNYLVFN